MIKTLTKTIKVNDLFANAVEVGKQQIIANVRATAITTAEAVTARLSPKILHSIMQPQIHEIHTGVKFGNTASV